MRYRVDPPHTQTLGLGVQGEVSEYRTGPLPPPTHTGLGFRVRWARYRVGPPTHTHLRAQLPLLLLVRLLECLDDDGGEEVEQNDGDDHDKGDEVGDGKDGAAVAQGGVAVRGLQVRQVGRQVGRKEGRQPGGQAGGQAGGQG